MIHFLFTAQVMVDAVVLSVSAIKMRTAAAKDLVKKVGADSTFLIRLCNDHIML